MNYYSENIYVAHFYSTLRCLRVVICMVMLLFGTEALAQPYMEVRNIQIIDSTSSVDLDLFVHADETAIAIRVNYWTVNVDSGVPYHSLLCMDVPSIQLCISGKVGPVGSITCGVPVLKEVETSLFYTILPNGTLRMRIVIPFDSVFFAIAKEGQQYWLNIPYWRASDMYRYAVNTNRYSHMISRETVNVISYEVGDSREIVFTPRNKEPDVYAYGRTLPDKRIVGSIHAVYYK